MNKIAVFFIFLAAFSWATAGVFIKLLPQYSAFEILSLRFFIAFFVMTLFLTFNKKLLFILQELKNKKIWLLVLLILGCYYLGTLAFTLAPIGETTLLMAISPVFVFLYQYLIQKEKLSKSEKIGFILSIIGIFIFLYLNQKSNGIEYLLGNICAILVGVFFAIYAVLHKKIEYSSFNSLSISYGMFLVMIIPAFYYSSSIVVNISFISYETLYIILLGVVSTVIPTLAIIFVAKNLSSMITSSVFLLEILFGFILGYIFFNETHELNLILVLSLILLGTSLMIFSKKVKNENN